MDEAQRVEEAAEALRTFTGGSATVACILGSGQSDVLDLVDSTALPWGEVPHLHGPSVEGHAGEFRTGHLGSAEGPSILVMAGRLHWYEGHDILDVVRPVRAMAKAGISSIVFTNSAGAIADDLTPGSILILKDHINQMGVNPLTGTDAVKLGPRFPDLTHAYHPEHRTILREASTELGLTIREGVYAAMAGPSYETPAEIRMLRTMGADAVGMSTVPEVIAAHHMGVRCAALSCLTNLAAGISDKPLEHDDVIETAAKVRDDLSRLLSTAIPRMAQLSETA